jgi:ribosomal protein S18 acetylase RimI-like enzyme
MSYWRRANSADDDAIVAMCMALNAEDPGPHPVGVEQVYRTLATLRREPWRGHAVVLELDSVIVGYALLISFWSNEVGGELCTVDEIFIQPTHRSQGHGSRLLGELVRGSDLWGKGARGVSLEVTPANARAWRLYERLGFRGGNRALRRLTEET